MSKAEIHYFVPEASRPNGDTEKIINAMGEFQREQPFQSIASTSNNLPRMRTAQCL